MRIQVEKYLREYSLASRDALSIAELMEALEVKPENIILVKNACEDLVDDKLVQRVFSKKKPWYRWIINEDS